MNATVKIEVLSQLLISEEDQRMASRSHCPAPPILTALSEGKLDDEVRQDLIAHISQCSSCSDLLTRLNAFSEPQGQNSLEGKAERAWAAARPRLESAVRKIAVSRIPEKKRISLFAFLPTPAKWALSFCAALLLVGISLMSYRLREAGDSTSMASNSPSPASMNSAPSTPAAQNRSVELANAGPASGTSATAEASEPLSDKDTAPLPASESENSMKHLPSPDLAATADGVLSAGTVAHLTFDSVASREDSTFAVTGELSAPGISDARFHADLNPGTDRSVLEISRLSLNGSDILLDPPRAVAVALILANPGASIQPGKTLDVRILESTNLRVSR